MMKKASKGYTLFELLVTVAILLVALVAILAAYTGSSAMVESNRNLTTANSHASYVLEDIRNTLFSSIATNITNGTWNLNATAIASRGLTPLNSETIATTQVGAATNPLDVQVVVSWNDSRGRSKSITLRTLVSN